MRTTTITILLAVLLSTGSCGNRVERWADRFEESMEDFGEAMEEIADSTTLHSSRITINSLGDGRTIRISNKDRYLPRRFQAANFNALGGLCWTIR